MQNTSDQLSLFPQEDLKVENEVKQLHQNINNRFNSYAKDHCWQYDIRIKNLDSDLKTAGLNLRDMAKLKTSDFDFRFVCDKNQKERMINFIKRHEWLGSISQFTTHWFGCYYKYTLAGVILFNMPNAFSKILGEDTKNIERLISRGACISWSPKNLASNFLMWCIRYMVKKTRYRLFTAYSDPLAREIGIIYQACNFYYMGQNSGSTTRYINPYTGKIVSDRFFRVRSAYKKYAKELLIEWHKSWSDDQKMLWDNIPNNIEYKLRNFSKFKQHTSKKIKFPLKHKYCFILGKTKKETKKLRKYYEGKNKILPYPKRF